MKNNIFDFATRELSQDAFICWCLNWHNCGETASLYPLAQELLALMGEPNFPAAQELVIKQQFKKIDVLISFQGANKILIIEDKTCTSEHNEQISRYKNIIQALSSDEKDKLGIDSAVKIETVYFKTGYMYDYDCETVSDYKISGEVFFDVLKKYEGKSEILDDYVNHLSGLLEWYKFYGNYSATSAESPWDWNIAKYSVAQHNLMKDMLRERFPQSMWKAQDEAYKIRIGTNVGGRPWTEFTFAEKTYPDSDDWYYLFWRIDTDNRGPYISLRFYERFDKKNDVMRTRHIRMYESLRAQAQSLIANHPELKLDWGEVKGGYSGGYYETTILTICLKEPLKNWSTEKETVKGQILTITDCFA